MIYLDNGATSLHKPPQVYRAVEGAMRSCGNPGRGGHRAAMAAAEQVYGCREEAGKLFRCDPERVVLTSSCTHGLNMAIRTLIRPGDTVVVSGFEHNAVTRTLHALGARTVVAGRRLFDPEDTLAQFDGAIHGGVRAVVCTHVSNVFGYILPVEQIARLCRQRQVPLILDAAQSAGALEVDFGTLGAEFVAMPGHKGLLGPQGTGLLLCRRPPEPVLFGGTGSESRKQEMPPFLPDRGEAGTLNVPGIAGLAEGLRYLRWVGVDTVARREQRQVRRAVTGLERLGLRAFYGTDQLGTVSFLAPGDCEELAQALAGRDVAVRAGLHCAPLAHESAGTIETGTVRVSFGHDASDRQTDAFLKILGQLV